MGIPLDPKINWKKKFALAEIKFSYASNLCIFAPTALCATARWDDGHLKMQMIRKNWGELPSFIT